MLIRSASLFVLCVWSANFMDAVHWHQFLCAEGGELEPEFNISFSESECTASTGTRPFSSMRFDLVTTMLITW